MAQGSEFKFPQVPVCQAYVFINNHIPCKQNCADQADPAAYIKLALQDFMLKIRIQIREFPYNRIDQADPRERITGVSRIFKPKRYISICPVRPEPSE